VYIKNPTSSVGREAEKKLWWETGSGRDSYINSQINFHTKIIMDMFHLR
jgi:hypothetical protein